VKIDLEGFHGKTGIKWLNVLGTEHSWEEDMKRKRVLLESLVRETGLQHTTKSNPFFPGVFDPALN